MVTFPSGFEAELVRGILKYWGHTANWELVCEMHQPFEHFDKIDLADVDAVLGCFFEREWAQAVIDAGVVAVNMSSKYEDIPLPRVAADDIAVGRMGGEHLLSRGFEHYGFIKDPVGWASDRRLEGFRQIVEQDAGRAMYVYDALQGGSVYDPDLICKWLETVPKPIAVMGPHDHLARAVIRAATVMGLRVPEEVAVLGVDNHQWATLLADTPMSSIELDCRQTGYRAAQALDQLLGGEEVTSPQWVPPLGIVERRSTEVSLTEDRVVADALRYIREHCGNTLVVEDVLDAIGVSRRSLEQRMKKAIGQTPQIAIFRAQIEKSKPMLLGSKATMGEIARACGFTRQERFSVLFKRYTGMTPGKFRLQANDPSPAQQHAKLMQVTAE